MSRFRRHFLKSSSQKKEGSRLPWILANHNERWKKRQELLEEHAEKAERRLEAVHPLFGTDKGLPTFTSPERH